MNVSYEKRVGQNIHDIRKSAGFTQDRLAAKMQLRGCDITRSSIAKIEVGQRHVYVDEIRLIKEILGTEYDMIFA